MARMEEVGELEVGMDYITDIPPEILATFLHITLGSRIRKQYCARLSEELGLSNLGVIKKNLELTFLIKAFE